MKLLAFELANFSSSIGLSENNKIVDIEKFKDFRKHSQLLIPNIEQILNKHSWHYNDLQAIAVSIGPGSFTGIRISIAAARGLSLALNIPIISLSTPQIYIHKYQNKITKEVYNSQKNILVILESMRNELYIQEFNTQGLQVDECLSLSPEEIAQNYEKNNYISIGDGVKHIKEYNFDTFDMLVNSADLLNLAYVEKSNEKLYSSSPAYVRMPDIN